MNMNSEVQLLKNIISLGYYNLLNHILKQTIEIIS